ncbi:MAG: hypothetical protein ACFCA4_12635 [Cyanophyceae cyanobacterium]
MTRYTTAHFSKLVAEQVYRGVAPFQNPASPSPPDWRVVLLKNPIAPASVPDATNVDQIAGVFASQQVLPVSGYLGAIGTYVLEESTFNAATGNFDVPVAELILAAAGGGIPFESFVFVRGLKWIAPQSCTISSQTVTASGHGYGNGDWVTLFTGDGGSLPSGYTAASVVKVKSASANTFEIETLNGSAIALSSAGSDVYVADASGAWCSWENLPAAQEIGDGEEQKFALFGAGDGEVVS